ncbi:MAG: hypothetical protein EBQ65_01305 [Chitinophagaceae bacterium]|nr:hypothetical protein [Chitinophagaceae bacterium]
MWSTFKIAGLTFLAIIIYLISDQYIFTPHYVLQKPEAFNGKYFYNPYENLSLNNTFPINLHGHTYAWQGFTNGKGNSDLAKKKYDSLGFYFAAISQYHFVENKNDKIKVYEHGINVKKTHQLILGSNKVIWKDYLLPQTLNQKQHVLNLLSEDTNSVICINHPGIRDGYKKSDFKYLQQYHLIEGLRPNHNFINYWDTALTYGHPVTLIGNDDFHNIYNVAELGNHLTISFMKYENELLFLQALKKGQCAVASLNHNPEANLIQRKRKIERLQQLVSEITIKKETVYIYLNEPVAIRWKSNNGLVKQESNSNISFYLPKPNDTYVRIEISTTDSIDVYFNSIYRSNDGKCIDRNSMAKRYLKINKSYNATIIGGNLMLTILVLSLIVKFISRKKKKLINS